MPTIVAKYKFSLRYATDVVSLMVVGGLMSPSKPVVADDIDSTEASSAALPGLLLKTSVSANAIPSSDHLSFLDSLA